MYERSYSLVCWRYNVTFFFPVETYNIYLRSLIWNGQSLNGTKTKYSTFESCHKKYGSSGKMFIINNASLTSRNATRLVDSVIQCWGQFHLVNSNSTQFYLANSNSTSNLSIPIQFQFQIFQFQFRGFSDSFCLILFTMSRYSEHLLRILTPISLYSK